MPRKCKICSHDQSEKINSLIVNGAVFRRIALDYGMSDASVHRHTQNCLKLDLQSVQEQIKKGQAIDYHAEVAESMQKIKKMLNACEEWLQDPDDPDKYTITPRSEDVKVIYDEPSGKSYVRKSKTLEELLDDVRKTGKQIVRVKLLTDNRKLFLDTMKDINTKLDAVAKTQGKYLTKQDNPVNLSPEQDAAAYYKGLLQIGATPEHALKVTRENRLATFEVTEDYIT